MYQRDLARKAWADVGLYDTKDAKLRQFLKHVDEAPTDCWAEVADLIRTSYQEYLEKLVVPLWNTGDRLLRLNLIRHADLKRPDEQKLAKKLMPRLRVETDVPELRAIICAAPVEVLDVIARRKGLSYHLRVLAETRRASLTA